GGVLRDRGPLLARRRSACRRGLRTRGRGGDLPAARVAHRHPHGSRPDAAGLSPCSDVRDGGGGRLRQGARSLMLDDRVLEVLARLEREDAEEREHGLPPMRRSRAVAPTTGRFLFSLVAPQTDCGVLEIGGSRGYSLIWLGAGVPFLRGRVLSVEREPGKIRAWRPNAVVPGVDALVHLAAGGAAEAVRVI